VFLFALNRQNPMVMGGEYGGKPCKGAICQHRVQPCDCIPRAIQPCKGAICQHRVQPCDCIPPRHTALQGRNKPPEVISSSFLKEIIVVPAVLLLSPSVASHSCTSISLLSLPISRYSRNTSRHLSRFFSGRAGVSRAYTTPPSPSERACPDPSSGFGERPTPSPSS
jgi:hypothetical protein